MLGKEFSGSTAILKNTLLTLPFHAGSFKPNVPFECFQSIKKAKRARKVNWDTETNLACLGIYHMDSVWGLQFCCKLLKLYSKTYADSLIIS